MKIRLVTFYEAPNCWNILNEDVEDVEIDVQLNNYVSANINKTKGISTFIVYDQSQNS